MWKNWEGTIGTLDLRAQRLGSWSLDVHHTYDPVGRILHLGDGSRRSVQNIDNVIETVAGGRAGGYSGDGGPASEAKLHYPYDVAVAPDGSLYIADTNNFCVRRVGPDGIITTVAGTGEQGYSGDGGPATEATFDRPYGIAVAPDGSLYIADKYNYCIRRVGTDGFITTVAGTGLRGYSGDGGPATEARMMSPHGIDVSPDGSLYIADVGNHRIRRVGPDGIITTVAGNGYIGYGGDGGPATEASFEQAVDVALAPDGSLYIADRMDNRIRRVGPNGIITTIAGTGVRGYSGDGVPATKANLDDPRGVVVAPDGSLYIVTSSPIRQITSPLPGFTVADIIIPSEDGGELFHFGPRGRHLATLNALTGATLYDFEYNEAGLLITVKDGDGNVTTIERDSDGNSTAIVGPYGQHTTFGIDANGYLESITNPANETNSFKYTDDGLLTSMNDPRGYTYRYTYNDLGLLVKAEDPAGGFKELERTKTENGYEVSSTTAMGNTNIYSVERLSTGEKLRVHKMGCCAQNEELIGTDGSRTITWADGTVVTKVMGPDPRWGMLAPIQQSLTIATPGGLQYVIETSRTVTLTNPDDLLSLETLTDTLTIN
ncbi:Virginiamycin B lyase [subsurface metagenome]